MHLTFPGYTQIQECQWCLNLYCNTTLNQLFCLFSATHTHSFSADMYFIPFSASGVVWFQFTYIQLLLFVSVFAFHIQLFVFCILLCLVFVAGLCVVPSSHNRLSFDGVCILLCCFLLRVSVCTQRVSECTNK